MLGIAQRKRAVIFGAYLLKHMDQVKYVLIASDASLKTQERLIKKCYYYKLPYAVAYTGEAISKALGKSGLMAVGINGETST